MHPEYGGNKWRKLKYNLKLFFEEKHSHLITFGGPFSNHIAATAAICRDQKIPCVGIIRGEMIDDNNPTLNKAKEDGMILHHIPKEEYRLKEKSELFQKLVKNYENPLVIPEGGNNDLGRHGMKDLMNEIDEQEIKFDYIFVAAGTGTTASGIIRYCRWDSRIMIVNVLKNPSLQQEIESHVSDQKNWEILSDYHFGGYAKTTEELQDFANAFYQEHEIKLDPVYNAKMMYAGMDLIKKEKISKDSNILAIHTGGHQGITAYDYVRKSLWLRTNN